MRMQEEDWGQLVRCPQCGTDDGVLVDVEPTMDEPCIAVRSVPCGCDLTAREREEACYAAVAVLNENAWADAGDSAWASAED